MGFYSRFVVGFLLLAFSVSGWCDCYTSSGFKQATLQADCSYGVNIGSGCSIENAKALGSSINDCGRCITPYSCNSGVLVVTGQSSTCYNNQTAFTYTFTSCDTQCERDSVACVNNPKGTWNADNCTCDTLCPADTTYRCQNSSIGSSTYGVRPVAKMYRCVTTCSSSDVCTETIELNGTCQDWGFCEGGQANCDVLPDSTGRPPCNRSGAGTTSSRACYYQCPDGTHMSCTPTSTEYVAGNIVVGICPDRPPASCYPPASSSDAAPASSSDAAPASSSDAASASSSDGSGGGGGDDSDKDYTPILTAILDTLHRANQVRDDIDSWGVRFWPDVSKIQENTFNDWRETNDINVKLRTYQDEGFNLASDVESDLDSSRLLLDEINELLRHDSVKVYGYTDTSANPILRDIRNKMITDSSLSRSDSQQVELFKNAFAPYMPDSGIFKFDGLFGDLANAVISAFGRDSSTSALCERYYACLRSGGGPAACSSIDPSGKCTDGGTPLDGQYSLLEAIWNGLFGDDDTLIPSSSSVLDSSVDLSGVLSALTSLSSASDSLGRFDIAGIVDSVKNMLDSAKRKQADSVKIQPDSLWLDSSGVVGYVDHILLPSGTLSECFVCRADLGTFGGLTDTSLKVYIDFSDFGGYNWCGIIRAVVKIATLVVCISLTLGSWAAAFGYNPKNDA